MARGGDFQTLRVMITLPVRNESGGGGGGTVGALAYDASINRCDVSLYIRPRREYNYG